MAATIRVLVQHTTHCVRPRAQAGASANRQQLRLQTSVGSAGINCVCTLQDDGREAVIVLSKASAVEIPNWCRDLRQVTNRATRQAVV